MPWDVTPRSCGATVAVYASTGGPGRAWATSAKDRKRKASPGRAADTSAPYHPRMLAKLPRLEADLQRLVIRWAKRFGWTLVHFRTAQTGGRWQTPVQGDGAGFPDLVMTRGGRLVFAELKSDVGQLDPDQVMWLDKLRAVAGVEVHVWRPSDLAYIVRVLTNTN